MAEENGWLDMNNRWIDGHRNVLAIEQVGDVSAMPL
jgi:hypothetical protein